MRPLNLVVKYFIETSFEFSNKFEKQANMKNSHELSTRDVGRVISPWRKEKVDRRVY